MRASRIRSKVWRAASVGVFALGSLAVGATAASAAGLAPSGSSDGTSSVQQSSGVVTPLEFEWG